MTSVGKSSGRPAARTSSATPSRRKVSIVRAATVLHFELGGSPACPRLKHHHVDAPHGGVDRQRHADRAVGGDGDRRLQAPGQAAASFIGVQECVLAVFAAPQGHEARFCAVNPARMRERRR